MEITTGLEMKEKNSSDEKSTEESPILVLRKKLGAIKKHWRERIIEHSNRFNDISNMPVIFQEIYNDKQQIIENKAILQERVAGMLKKVKLQEKELYLHYLQNSDIKIKSHQAIIKMIDADLAEYQEKIDIITHHIDFLIETNFNIQNILYGIKARTDLEEYNDYQK